MCYAVSHTDKTGRPGNDCCHGIVVCVGCVLEWKQESSAPQRTTKPDVRCTSQTVQMWWQVPGVGLEPSFLEEPVMLLAIVLLGRTLETRARLRATGGCERLLPWSLSLLGMA
jgi:hypothetical protein